MKRGVPRPLHIHFAVSEQERAMAEDLARRDEKNISDLVRDLIRTKYREVAQPSKRGN